MVIDPSPFFGTTPFERLVRQLWEPSQMTSGNPPLNISQSEAAVTVSLEVPGMAIEDLELTLSDQTLFIKGERKPRKGKYFHQERPGGPFQRLVNISEPVDAENVKARMQDGVLTITVPKAQKSQPKKISIDIND